MSELRKDPVVDRWVIMSEERAVRPSDFSTHAIKTSKTACPFCSGNEHYTPSEVFADRPDQSAANKPGWKLRVVPNKFPALATTPHADVRHHHFFSSHNGYGRHEVIVETPVHGVGPSDLSVSDHECILKAYRHRLLDMQRDPRLAYALLFKNHGALAGATVDHTHSQMIATPIVPFAVEEELRSARDYHADKQECVYCRLLKEETSDGTRLIGENDAFVAIQAFASRFPCETWILPKRHTSHFELHPENEMSLLAGLMKETFQRLHRALDDPPFNTVIHSAPLRDRSHDTCYHWHIEILPKLTQVAGYEWGSGVFINPLLPEQAAQSLRQVTLS